MRTRLCFLCLAAAAIVLAQSATSRISGTVTDSSGGVVPGAQVTATNENTGVAYSQKTTDAGLYSFPALPVGTYSITVEAAGFKKTVQSGNILEVETPLTVNVSLSVGQTTETVVVQGAYEKLQVTNATLGDVIEHKTMVDLPLNGRNPLALLLLEPGIVQRSSNATGSGVHVNGSRDRAFNVTIDGIDANESTVPSPMKNLYRLNPDNIQEYKVTTSNATPEEGRNSGASISVATRMGSNAFHGTVFEFFRNTALNANEFYANAQGTEKPGIHLNQYGFEAGGPIRKDKTFFFVTWAGQKINFAQPVDQTYGNPPGLYTPTAASGIFRYFVGDPNNPFRFQGQTITRNSPVLVDPVTGALLPGVRTCGSPSDLNCVASYNMFTNDPKKIGADPVIAKLLQSLPKPNTYAYGDGLNTAAYEWNSPSRTRGPNYMVRIDHTFNENNAFFARWLLGDQDTLGGDPNNSRPQLYPGFPPLGEVFRHSKNLAASYRRVISPRTVNEFTAGFSRFVLLFTQGEANPSWPNVPSYMRASGTAFNLLDAPYRAVPRTFRAVTTPQILDNLSMIRGSHVLKTGFNFRFYQHNDQRGEVSGTTVTPTTSFSPTTRQSADPAFYNAFNLPAIATPGRAGMDPTDNVRLLSTINDVMGIPSQLTQAFLGDLKSDTFLPFRTGDSVTLWDEGHRLKEYNYYVQDEWKLRKDLTVTYGVRWEINMAPTEAAGRVYVPDKAMDGSQGLVSFVHANTWFNRNNLGALGPRLGLAWSPRHNTVVRAGYGIAFDTVSSFQVTAAAGKVPGLSTSCSAVAGGKASAGCASVPDLRIGQGFPNELAPPSVKPSSFLSPPAQLLNNSPAAITFDPNLKIPTVHQWNFNIQHELPKGFVAQIGYIGRRGTRLFRAYDLNQIDATPILPSFLAMQRNYLVKKCNPDGTGCPSGVAGETIPIVASGAVTGSFVNSSTSKTDLSRNGAGNMAGRIEQSTLALHLRPNQQFGTITYLDSGGDSYYHSLQATVRKRFESGLLFGLAYTFGKSLDDQSVDPVGSTSSGALSSTTSRAPASAHNWRGERGRSDFDRTHVVVSNWIYELPFGKGKTLLRAVPGPLNHVVGGWSLNGIYTFMSGEPFTVRSGARTANYAHESRAVLAGPKPAVEYVNKAGAYGPVAFADPSVFTQAPPGSDGMGRNTFTAPGYWNVDVGVNKRFDLTERFKLQFRAEMFNAFNHPNFDNPRDATSGSLSILSTVFAQTCCATVAPPSTQSIIDTGEAARVVQFALKLSF